jgi:hypothetical protein
VEEGEKAVAKQVELLVQLSGRNLLQKKRSGLTKEGHNS